MRPLSFRLALLSLLCGGVAMAQRQNTEISVLLGAVGPTSHVVVGPNVIVTGTTGGAVQIGFSYQVLSFSAGYLYVEMPTTVTFHESGTVVGNGTVSAVDNSMSMYTPGVRLKLPIQSRVSLYAVAGGGFGSFHRNEATVSGGSISVSSRRTTHGVFDFGGGIDFRLTRLLSLRAEVRDFVTGKNLGGVSGPNHPVTQFGVAFHF